MWNKTADVHERLKFNDVVTNLNTPDYLYLDATEQRILADIDVKTKAVAQLSCNNGRELLSIKKLGAGECVGFDISDKFIQQAQSLVELTGLNASFVRTDVYDISAEYTERFDVLYVTVGALGWLPDLGAYMAVVSRLLKPGGKLFIYEMHPILDMFDNDTGLTVKHSYFRTEPYVEDAAPDYYDPSQIVEGTSYWFHHKLSDIIGACITQGLILRLFEEHPHDLSMVFKAFQDFETKLPLSYALVAEKPAT